ncbi:MAG TPA: zinc-binding dehydrogenase [Aldersonia sp.]
MTTTTTTTRALVGGLAPEWAYRDVEVPGPGPGQILVRVRLAALNRADLYMLAGTYSPNTKTSDVFTAGLELAGEVEAVGTGVSTFAVGDRVMGAGLGAFAGHALIDHRHALAVPASLSWTDAAALPVGLATEHDALVTQGGFAAGERVLVVGATTGIGLIGVQLAKALGAGLVVATTTSDTKARTLREVGADVVVNTMTDSLVEVVHGVTDGAGVDLVLDHIGGQLFAQLLSATRVRGSIVNIGRLGGAQTTIDLDVVSFRRLRVQGTTFSVRTAEERGDVYAALATEVLPVVADGRVRPVVDRVFPFGAAHEAADYLRSGAPVGKLVLEMP